MKKPMMNPIDVRRFFKLAMLPVVAWALGGCAIIGLRKQDAAISASGMVTLFVEGAPKGVPVYGLALRGDRAVVGAQECAFAGVAAFALPLGASYDGVAFADLNRNRVLDANEPAAVARGLSPVPLADPDAARQVHVLKLASSAPAGLVGVAVPEGGGDAVPLAVGEVAKIGDKRFSAAIGEEGLWKPDTSLRAGNLGLYFTEPYDPGRVPVVFVHGIGGSPQDFAKLIPELDRTKYQAWFFTYPSGFRLGKAATALATLTTVAAQRQGVERLHVVAHSMGGLVSRAAILKMDAGRVKVERFVSISTPWDGHEAAAAGVRALKHPVPSWIDMAPGSAFLKELWSHELPEPTRHWLIFGYDTRRLPWLTLNNDQVINVRSSLYVPAQEEAVRVFGLEQSHEGILADGETAVKMNEYLGE